MSWDTWCSAMQQTLFKYGLFAGFLSSSVHLPSSNFEGSSLDLLPSTFWLASFWRYDTCLFTLLSLGCIRAFDTESRYLSSNSDLYMCLLHFSFLLVIDVCDRQQLGLALPQGLPWALAPWPAPTVQADRGWNEVQWAVAATDLPEDVRHHTPATHGQHGVILWCKNSHPDRYSQPGLLSASGLPQRWKRQR